MCVDTMIDATHCGACNTSCTVGRVCVLGECICAKGTIMCDRQCIDPQKDNANCGACDHKCSAIEACREGVCTGGIAGDDGCEGLADDINLTQFSLFQTVELPLMKEGKTNDPGIDVVAGKTSLAVAYVKPGDSFERRELSARLLLEVDGKVKRLYSINKLTPIGPTIPGKRSTWFEFDLPAEQLVERANYAVEVVNCGETKPGKGQVPRFPESSYASFGAREYGSLRITLVPIMYNQIIPVTSDEIVEEYAEAFQAMYPVSSVKITVRKVPTQKELPITDPKDWVGNLDLLRALRTADAAPDNVYYYGLIQPTQFFSEFCVGSCSGGIGYVAVEDGRFEPAYRAAMGLGFLADRSIRVAVHEIGHAHGREHAPCAVGGLITGVDPKYPYEDGLTGVWGWDFRGDRLLHSPEWSTDIMGYCDNPWVSDYTYAGFGIAVRNANGIADKLRFEVVKPEQVGNFYVLLVQPNRLRWRTPRPPGSVAFGKAEQAWVLDASGAPLKAIQVYRVDLSDSNAYSLEVPAPEPGWHALQLAGVGTPIVFP
jgi:hypothetical protein